ASPLLAALSLRPAVPVGGAPPTLATLLGAPPWLVIIVLAVGGAIWMAGAPGEPQHCKWAWPVTGVTAGILIAGGWWASSIGGPPVGLTFAVNTGELLTYPLVGFPNRVNWSMVMLVGVPVGAFIAAWSSGEFSWKLPPSSSLVKIFSGGLLMGASAIVAAGCNVTQGRTNGSATAVGSLVTLLSMLAGGWLTLWPLYLRKG